MEWPADGASWVRGGNVRLLGYDKTLRSAAAECGWRVSSAWMVVDGDKQAVPGDAPWPGASWGQEEVVWLDVVGFKDGPMSDTSVVVV